MNKRFSTLLFALLLSIMLSSASYAQDCDGWGGIDVGGEIVCCSCELSDGICPDDLAGSTVCTYGDYDCGNCDTTAPNVNWVDPTASTSWVDGNYVFETTGTDPTVSGEVTRGMYNIGEFFVNGIKVGNTTGSDGSSGDTSLNVWITYDTTTLTSGIDHSFKMRMSDLAGNTKDSSTLSITVCNDKDPLSCKDACESEYNWTINDSTGGNEFCCGDDTQEYLIEDYDSDYGDGYACCPNEDDCAYQEHCFGRDTEYSPDGKVYYYCGEENTIERLCEEPAHVGYVDPVTNQCCTIEGTSSSGSFQVYYHQINNDSITSESYYDSGCFDGLDTDCSGAVEDCDDSQCGFEGMGLTWDKNSYQIKVDNTRIDYNEWWNYYNGFYDGYDKSVVDDKCCTDDSDNDGNGCRDDNLEDDGYADWKCNDEINNVAYDGKTTMFDLIDNDCDGYFDFGNVPYSQDGNWSNYDQKEEIFEERSGDRSAKILLHGTVKDMEENPIPNAKVTAWLRDGWYQGLERTEKDLESMNENHRDYFTTFADENGKYEIYINAHMPYTFVASQPEATEARTTYDSAIRSVQADDGIVSFNTRNYQWDPKLWRSDMVKCDGCNLVGSNRCYAGCVGEEKGCNFPDWADTAQEQQQLIFACADMLSSTSVYYNSTHDVLCCNGSLIKRPSRLEAQPKIDEQIKNAVTHTETVSLEGIPVKMKIVLFEKK